ncbi:MAG: LLM class flavin-dependent oxidoreductase [Solirubrobacterales bacterium]
MSQISASAQSPPMQRSAHSPARSIIQTNGRSARFLEAALKDGRGSQEWVSGGGIAMKLGHSLWFSNEFDLRAEKEAWSDPLEVTDAAVYRNDLRLALLTEELGFDSLWMPEHHFSPYCMTTNQLQLLSYVAAKTERIELGTMVSVLPWHDPIRLAESFAVLDLLVEGERRIHFGVGRGFAKREYDGFRVDKADATGRFRECLDVVRLALSRERFSYEGEHFNIPETGLRPRPITTDLTKSIYGSWTSDEVMELSAHEGLGQLHAPAFDIMKSAASAAAFNQIRGTHGWDPIQPGVVVFVHCAEGDEEVELGQEWARQSFETALWHYDFFNQPPLKEMLAAKSADERAEFKQGMVESFLACGAFGTPAHCLAHLEDLKEKFDASLFLCVFRFGRMPFEAAEKSMRLFASDVAPAVRDLPSEEPWATPYEDVLAAHAEAAAS